MRALRAIVTLSLLTISMIGYGQKPISLDFSKQFFREEFNDQNENWTYMTTVENLYVADKGELFMNRNSANGAYAFLTKVPNSLRQFSIEAAMKLGPAESQEQSIGLIFLVQRDGKGAVVVEFNKNKEFRMKQLVGQFYKFLSGKPESQGWVKNKDLKGGTDLNVLEVRVNLPQIDLYINGKFAYSADVMDYTDGAMGLLVGPMTKAKVDYFFVYTTEEGAEEVKKTDPKEAGPKNATEVIAKMRYELEHAGRQLKECETERKTAVSRLEDDMSRLSLENDRLSVQNRQLAEFRDQLLVDVDEDVFLSLAENLKLEILKNQKLERQVQVYKDSLRFAHENYSKLKLALLDKGIRNAQKEKAERERKEAESTKEQILGELRDQKLTKEQEEWEKKNAAKIDQAAKKAPLPTADKPGAPAAEAKPAPVPAVSPLPEAKPLPVPVRKAKKKPN